MQYKIYENYMIHFYDGDSIEYDVVNFGIYQLEGYKSDAFFTKDRENDNKHLFKLFGTVQYVHSVPFWNHEISFKNYSCKIWELLEIANLIDVFVIEECKKIIKNSKPCYEYRT